MPKEDIKTLHWTLHPNKSIGLYVDSEGTKKYSCKGKKRSPWYDMECERNSAQIIAQELDIDYLASGNPYFDLQAVSKQEEWILSDETAGLGKYEIGLLARVDGKIKFRPNRNGLIRIYEHPGPLTQATAACLPDGEKVITDRGEINIETVSLQDRLLDKEGNFVSIRNIQR